MTDQELADELSKALGFHWRNGNHERMARRARELCGPTPEQTAVIEAAKDYFAAGPGCLTASAYSRMVESVKRLRESEAPKPRYTATGNHVYDETTHRRHEHIVRADTNELAERICRLLNADAEQSR